MLTINKIFLIYIYKWLKQERELQKDVAKEE